jgi:hypothetical protein
LLFIVQVRSQLTILQQEKEASEKQANDLLNQLKQHQENLIPELEKQCQKLKTELENRGIIHDFLIKSFFI